VILGSGRRGDQFAAPIVANFFCYAAGISPFSIIIFTNMGGWNDEIQMTKK
jgi:hypothetical protein